MLKITFKRPEKFVRNVDVYFNNRYEDEWFNDAYVKQMVRDVDRTDVIGPNLCVSDVLGPIPPTKLSGGVKNLILALKTDLVLYGSACGDNCAKWLVDIGSKKDVVIYLAHPMRFPETFEAYCIDYDQMIHSWRDFVLAYLKSRGWE